MVFLNEACVRSPTYFLVDTTSCARKVATNSEFIFNYDLILSGQLANVRVCRVACGKRSRQCYNEFLTIVFGENRGLSLSSRHRNRSLHSH